MEFKGDDHFPIHSSYERVLIESDWNLKQITAFSCERCGSVLIESDWNLKYLNTAYKHTILHRINRIRLEFKVNGKSSKQKKAEKVLIESDWNLKLTITA